MIYVYLSQERDRENVDADAAAVAALGRFENLRLVRDDTLNYFPHFFFFFPESGIEQIRRVTRCVQKIPCRNFGGAPIGINVAPIQ